MYNTTVIAPNMPRYFHLINNVKSTEYLVANRNNKLTTHNRKWPQF